jgi:hypothetical protein
LPDSAGVFLPNGLGVRLPGGTGISPGLREATGEVLTPLGAPVSDGCAISVGTGEASFVRSCSS